MARRVIGRGRNRLGSGDDPWPTHSGSRSQTGPSPGARWARAVALLTVLALLGAACTGAATPADEGGGDNGEGSDVENPGVFVHALGGEPESLDPARASDGGYGNRAIVQVYDFLVDLPADSAAPIPMLATEVPTQENGLVSDDGLVYTFPIREGVVFHDGTDLTADDVK